MSNKNHCKVALISFYDINAMGVRTLSSVLKEEGHEVHIIFFKQMGQAQEMGDQLRTESALTIAEPHTQQNMDDLINLLIKLNPDIIGISLRSSFYKLFVETSIEIKKKTRALLIVGGIHPTVSPEECIDFSDIVCIGEGEEAFAELADRIALKEDIKQIKNLWIKIDGEIIKNELRPFIDLNKVPFIDYGNENKHYIDAKPLDISVYDIMSSRGCPFSCTYCCNSTLRSIFKGKGSYVRRRTVDNVIDELKFAKKTYKEIRHIRFQDDVFTFDKNWLKEFKSKYKQEINIPFSCYVHSSMIDEDTIQMLTDCGVVAVAMGIQSGSERTRRNIFNRNVTNDEIIKAAKNINNRVAVQYDMILDNPFEDTTDVLQTLDLMLAIPRPYNLCILSLIYFPKTKITYDALKNGFIKEEDVEGMSQKALSQWMFTRSYNRPKDLNTLYSLIILAQSYFVPRELIELFKNKIDILKDHTEILDDLFKSINAIKRDSLNHKNIGCGVPSKGILPYYMQDYFNINDEVEYRVLLYSNEIEYKNAIFSMDIYPANEPSHPGRHLGFWNKRLDKVSGSKDIKIKLAYPKARFIIDGKESNPDHQWIGSIKENGAYLINFYLWEENNNVPVIHEKKVQLIFQENSGIIKKKLN